MGKVIESTAQALIWLEGIAVRLENEGCKHNPVAAREVADMLQRESCEGSLADEVIVSLTDEVLAKDEVLQSIKRMSVTTQKDTINGLFAQLEYIHELAGKTLALVSEGLATGETK